MGVTEEVLARFTRALAAESSPELPRRLCGAFARVIDADGAAINVGNDPASRALLAVTDERIEQILDLQDMVGEGPTLEAMRGEGPVILPDAVRGHDAWPVLTHTLVRSAAVAPVAALYAFPMRPRHEVLGVLTVHQLRRADLAISVRDAQDLANVVGVAVLGDLGLDRAPGQSKWLERDRISQASGMVIAQLGVPGPDAMAILRAHAYARDLTLTEVCRRVLSRSLRFSTDPEED